MGKVENMERVMTEKGCDNCYYSYFDEKAYPCSLCIRGIERTDQWQPSRKTKADRKTEPMETTDYCKKCNHKGCEICAADGSNPYCVPSRYEPQTDCSWKKGE